MHLTDSFLSAVGHYVLSHKHLASEFDWRVGEAAWQKLGTGFEHWVYGDDQYGRHVALKWHLAEHWSKSPFDEKVRVAGWLVREWGGIKRNASETIVGYVNQADACRPATPFSGVASYSKIFSIKDPAKFAIFDARVSTTLNAAQLLMLRDGTIRQQDLMYFPMPTGQNTIVKYFAKAARPEIFIKKGFRSERNRTYETYMTILLAITGVAGVPSVLDAEMILFVAAPRLSQEALHLVQ
jgi:hypothetical protein